MDIMSLDFYLEYKNDDNDIEVFDINITHNLTKMASEAGIYESLWHPETINAVYGKDIIDILEKGLKKLKERPEYFKQFNASNGWGMYKHFVPFVEDCLNACKQYPNAKIHASV